MSTAPSPNDTLVPPTYQIKFLIIGAGTFGLSTALHLLQRGYKDVTVLDRAQELPAKDAASTDINKIVRSSYADKFYTELAREAITEWHKHVWEGCYHACGTLSTGNEYMQKAYDNDFQNGANVALLPTAESIRNAFPSSLHSDTDSGNDLIGDFTGYTGYFNNDGGWAEAERAVSILFRLVRKEGGVVVPGKEVVDLLRNTSGCTEGVRCKDGTVYSADRVIVASGAWTASAFPALELDKRCLATGQTVATVQLTSEEAEQYRQCPVVLNFRTGFYVFPPTSDNIIKFAIHAAGHTHTVVSSATPVTPSDASAASTSSSTVPRKVSTPRTILSHPTSSDGLRVPRSALALLREHLRTVYPALANMAWSGTRMCWYTDSPDGDWVIGPYPGDPGLFLATSGSGHAFKFLPNIGRLVADALEGKLDPAVAARFAVDRDVSEARNDERVSQVTQELDVDELCRAEDMIPSL
ncbi:FAD dependent oxidoreductase [Phlebopus sp. FC_14]|nr:FAD dependent oxidoreductase [Phlebopus sp. FC_14]